MVKNATKIVGATERSISRNFAEMIPAINQITQKTIVLGKIFFRAYFSVKKPKTHAVIVIGVSCQNSNWVFGGTVKAIINEYINPPNSQIDKTKAETTNAIAIDAKRFLFFMTLIIERKKGMLGLDFRNEAFAGGLSCV